MADSAADGSTGFNEFWKNWCHGIAPGPEKPFAFLSSTATSSRYVQGQSNEYYLFYRIKLNMVKQIPYCVYFVFIGGLCRS